MNKVALITGVAGNLGKAVAAAFLAAGYQVTGTILPGEGAGLDPAIDARAVDLTSEEATQSFINQVAQQYQQIDVAVFTVGGFAMGDITETDLSAIHKMLKLNFDTAYNSVRATLPLMKKAKKGNITLIGARPALDPSAGKGVVAYALSKSLIFELAAMVNAEKSGVVAQVIVPSIIDTPQNRAGMPDANFADWVKPEEIAQQILVGVSSSALREPIFKMYGNA